MPSPAALELAEELQIPVIAVQLSRARPGPNQRPALDLRNRRHRADADIILFIFREELYPSPTKDNGQDLIIAKQRTAPSAWSPAPLSHRPRDQGRRPGRAEDAGAPRRHRHLLRRRQLLRPPDPPHDEEPLRARGGDGGVRDGRKRGLSPVENPSSLFLSQRRAGAPGSVVFCCLEGTLPVLVETQALVAGRLGDPPRRRRGSTRGNGRPCFWRSWRKGRPLALRERRLPETSGRGRADQPSRPRDLPVACALASSFLNRPARVDTVVFGEVGLVESGPRRGPGRGARPGSGADGVPPVSPPPCEPPGLGF